MAQQIAINTDEGLVFEETRGRFFCRRWVEHEYQAVRAICARRVATDIRMFTAISSNPFREDCRILGLTQVNDPFEGFTDDSDWGPAS